MYETGLTGLFQSRNRDSFDFKLKLITKRTLFYVPCFNLVIEILLISRVILS